jgi:extracellular matrix regulatory protein A
MGFISFRFARVLGQNIVVRLVMGSPPYPARTGGRKSMAIKLINIGFGNIVSANRIISIVSPESAPIKRIIQEARDRGMLIDATYGRRTRAVIVTDSDHVILSAVQPETVAHRLTNKDDDSDE